MNISIKAEPLAHIGTFPLTNTLVNGWVILIALTTFAFLLSRRLTSVPGRVQAAVEIIIETLLAVAEQVTANRSQARKFFPVAATIFIFVLFSNWVEILPGLGTVGFKEMHHGREVIVPFIRSPSADLNFTMALAITSVISVQVFGIATLGFFHYAGKFINFHGPIHFFVGVLELFSELAKIVSFSFRLFGNIFAGEVLLMVMLFLAPYIVPVPFVFLEICVGFIQATIFGMLTLVFTKMAVTAHEHE